MNKKHEKSSCCEAMARRFGGRRRQCVRCLKTWSVWKKKTGRKRIRVSLKQAQAFTFGRLLPLRHKGRQTRNERSYRLSLSRKKCASSSPWPDVPVNAPLIMIADALVKYVGKKWHTWYIMLVRPVNEDSAYAIPCYHKQGTETVGGWRRAFETIDQGVMKRVKALVCDGHRGLVHEAKWRELVLQRCHFHLISRIQSRRSKWRTGRHQPEGRRIYELVRRILIEPDPAIIAPLVNELEEFSWTTRSPDLRRCLSGFVNHHQDFRSFLEHSELRLPTTSNSAEAMIGLIENMCRRARGFVSVEVTDEWIISVLKTRKMIRCAPAKYQQN